MINILDSSLSLVSFYVHRDDGEAMDDKWTGVFPAVTTKFKEDHSLDLAAMERHFQFQLDAGVRGLVDAMIFHLVSTFITSCLKISLKVAHMIVGFWS